VLRLIKRAIDAAHERGIKAAMCGELAGDPEYTMLLTGLGLDEFSMTSSSIPLVKHVIRNTTMESCRTLAQQVMGERSIAGVKAVMRKWMLHDTHSNNP
jgi:phosphotransferase system enzyme I (PtsI)